MALGMTAGCPVRMSEKHLRFVIGLAASGICHVSQVPPYHSLKAPLLAHAHLAPGCHARRRHYRSRGDSAPLDRGTGKVPLQS
ncbi:unnamed protein product [Staurois parvus]|uniref:Uncharacterized protein n=1 Tax=Staurois parvus TaxID=386267 RepID=A0ABN9E4E8_9NEOB|nr:unnamed protein product [Staurois parvus]